MEEINKRKMKYGADKRQAIQEFGAARNSAAIASPLRQLLCHIRKACQSK
jgi:hypothetical protein